MKTYFIVTPSDKLPRNYNAPTVYMEYTVSGDGFLLRRKDAGDHQGGMMGICFNTDFPCEKSELYAAMMNECEVYRYNSILLFGNKIPQKVLSALEKQNRYPVYLPYHFSFGRLNAVLDTAVSGGSLEEYLAQNANGKNALYIAQTYADFTLPAKGGAYRDLTADEFKKRYEKCEKSTHFSSELCARYFTYFKDHKAHFVLYDDSNTIEAKLQLGEKFAFPIAFLPVSLYPNAKKKDG